MMATTFWHPDGTPMSAQQFGQYMRDDIARSVDERRQRDPKQ